MATTLPVVEFLEGKTVQLHGEMNFAQVMGFEDEKMEHIHNWVQWVFPLKE